MLRIIIICLLIANALFWGLYPHTSHCQITKIFGINKCPHKMVHYFAGIFFFILAIYIAQYY